MFLIGTAALLLVIAAIVLVALLLRETRTTPHAVTGPERNEDAGVIVADRFARGKITEEKFQRLSHSLNTNTAAGDSTPQPQPQPQPAKEAPTQ